MKTELQAMIERLEAMKLADGEHFLKADGGELSESMCNNLNKALVALRLIIGEYEEVKS